MQNIILIGMPGCGKSSIGQALANTLHRPFIDADAEIVRRVGCSIPEDFRKGRRARLPKDRNLQFLPTSERHPEPFLPPAAAASQDRKIIRVFTRTGASSG